MQRQTEMEQTMLTAHRQFMTNLGKAVNMLEQDIDEAAEMSHICTDEWCLATENVLDELQKSVYSISEPRWLTKEDSETIRKLRRRIRDLYVKYKSAGPK